jgi:hypothetical protein
MIEQHFEIEKPLLSLKRDQYAQAAARTAATRHKTKTIHFFLSVHFCFYS